MEISEIVKTTEFIAALSGVVAGFFFTLLSDLARSLVRRWVRKFQISREVKMIKEDSRSAIKTCIENNKIRRGSKKSPLMHASLDCYVIEDKGMLLDAGLSISQRRSLRDVELISEAIVKECETLRQHSLDYRPKIEWESSNINICHYFAFIVYACDEYLCNSSSTSEPVNGEQFHERNEEVLSHVERKYKIEIPRDIRRPA
ncbi:hypothetical protein [Halomonas sp.]|uniref:hypothetical protein n=1 Tax=Halomonas sp. TaxID=1486246 RepID=UPI00257EE4E5|nr:hypothetical protein [Halomonas sp.]MCJ8287088.1 hypothetical protein [Halomonas sp.]NQY71804.1 hypothetical protein [Halomonas sp.]